MKINSSLFQNFSRIQFTGTPGGVDILAIDRIASSLPDRSVVYITLDDKKLSAAFNTLKAFGSDVTVLDFPAWDCLPYDRVSPNPELTGRRLNTLLRLNNRLEKNIKTPIILLTTVNAILQKVPSRKQFSNVVFNADAKQNINLDKLAKFLSSNGYIRTGTVREPGEVAFRGGIIDIYPPGAAMPVRLDLIGNLIDEIRRFDPADQRSLDVIKTISLQPLREYQLNKESISRFRERYRERFGNIVDDPLYETISEGRTIAGLEHWLPLINQNLETLTDFLTNPVLVFEHQCEQAIAARHELIKDFYDARISFLNVSSQNKNKIGKTQIYRPLPPDQLYLMESSWEVLLESYTNCSLTPFKSTGSGSSNNYDQVIDFGGLIGPEFSSIRNTQNLKNTTDEKPESYLTSVAKLIHEEHQQGRKVAIAAHSSGSRDRMITLLEEHGITEFSMLDSWNEFLDIPISSTGLFVLGIERGFRLKNTTVLSEQDIFGERIIQSHEGKLSSVSHNFSNCSFCVF